MARVTRGQRRVAAGVALRQVWYGFCGLLPTFATFLLSRAHSPTPALLASRLPLHLVLAFRTSRAMPPHRASASTTLCAPLQHLPCHICLALPRTASYLLYIYATTLHGRLRAVKRACDTCLPLPIYFNAHCKDIKQRNTRRDISIAASANG